MFTLFKKLVIAFSCLLMLSNFAIAEQNPKVLLTTNLGDIEIELNQQKAPISVANFLDYVESGAYNNTIFHRVINNFMIQGGAFTEDMTQKSSKAPIKNEANNGLKNDRGTIAMARTDVIDSATNQFFINLKDNDFLNHGQRDYGYAVFGKVTKGMDVIDKMAKVATTSKNGHGDVPVTPIIITSAKKL